MFFRRAFLLALGLATASAHAQFIPVLRLLVDRVVDASTRESTWCTATVLRDGDRCRLVTNAHCAFEGARIRIAYGPNDLPAKVLKRSARLDLMEIAFADPRGEKALGEVCPRLSPVDPERVVSRFRDRSASVSFWAVGFANGRLAQSYSKNVVWGVGGYGYSQWNLVPTGRHEAEGLFEVRELIVRPGMSGGALFESSLGQSLPIGIVTRFIPFQDVGYARPIATVLRWLRGDLDLTGDSALDDRIEGISAKHLIRKSCRGSCGASGDNNHGNGSGDNNHGNGGDNAHAIGGDNVHTNGGDNVHANGADDRLASLQKALDLLEEADEGFDATEFPGERLLAVMGIPIDGLSDYLRLGGGRLAADRQGLLLRPARGFPAEDIRRGLLARLDGVYTSHFYHAEAQHFVIYENAQDPQGWTTVASGAALARIDLNAKRKGVKLNFGHHHLALRGGLRSLEGGSSIASQDIAFSIAVSPDAKALQLVRRDGGSRLECANRHYLKLVCRSESELFSVAYEGPHTKKLSYRYTRVGQRQGGGVVLHHYTGTLGRSPIPDQERRGR